MNRNIKNGKQKGSEEKAPSSKNATDSNARFFLVAMPLFLVAACSCKKTASHETADIDVFCSSIEFILCMKCRIICTTLSCSSVRYLVYRKRRFIRKPIL